MRFAEHPASSPYQQGLDQNPANYAPLTPISFLERAADVFPERTAVIHGGWRADYAELRRRARRLASALVGRGVGPGDTVALMLPNVPAMLDAHFAIPMAGAVINALNIRLEAETIAYILDHGEAKVLLTDPEFSGVIKRGFGARRAASARGRRGRCRVRGRRASGWASSPTTSFWPRAIRLSSRSIRPTSGRRSRSATPRARPGGPRASSPTTAAPI